MEIVYGLIWFYWWKRKKKKLKEEEKDRKRKEFARIMASNLEVSVNKSTPIKKKLENNDKVCCLKVVLLNLQLIKKDLA